MEPRSRARSLLWRVLMVTALVAPPLVHTGCLQKAAYSLRLQQKVRAHVYADSPVKVMKAARKVAEDDGWTIVEDDSDERSFVTKTRSLDGYKQKLKVRVIKDDDGARVEGDLYKTRTFGDETKEQKFIAGDFELALLEKLDSDAADKLRSAAKKQSKEDAKQIRACARKALDEDEKADES
ncbi:MAG: hypothetical protein HYV09_14065 [Deltaproteobacteria bacterium]|nr:hypothetical protein [Deltaproteobacteria bacterium]